MPQVQPVGNGTVYNHEGLPEVKPKQASLTSFHKIRIPVEDELKATRFYRWLVDAALYDLNPPKVMTPYGFKVPTGDPQMCRRNDGVRDELKVLLGRPVFASGQTMSELLLDEYRSLAVRVKVKYALHPYVWMVPARATPTGFGTESEGLELSLEELPLWKAVRPSNSQFFGRTLSQETRTSKSTRAARKSSLLTLYLKAQTGKVFCTLVARITNPFGISDILYKMQRPAIAPQGNDFVLPQPWRSSHCYRRV